MTRRRALLASVALALAGCGRKGPLFHPEAVEAEDPVSSRRKPGSAPATDDPVAK